MYRFVWGISYADRSKNAVVMGIGGTALSEHLSANIPDSANSKMGGHRAAQLSANITESSSSGGLRVERLEPLQTDSLSRSVPFSSDAVAVQRCDRCRVPSLLSA